MKLKNHSIKGFLLSTAAVIVIGGLGGGNALAADGTWTFLTGNSNWTTATSWQSSIIPGAAGTTTSTDIGNFNGTIAANRTVNVDANRNIAGLKIGANNTNFAYIFNGGATGTFVLSAGGSIELDSTATSGTHRELVNASISLVGDATFSNNASGANRSLRIQAVTGSATLGNVSTLSINGSNNNANNELNNPIGNGVNGGDLALTKSGTGTWKLSGTSTYTGATTISAGTLLVTGTLGSTAVSVGANGTIGGTGALGGSLAFDGDSTFNVLNIADALAISGSVTFGSGFGINNLTGINWDTLDLNTPYTILDNATDFSVAGLDHFGLANAVDVGALGRQAYFQNGSLQVVVIPEPNVAALLGSLGLLALAHRRRN